MANHKSAKKRHRQSLKRRANNKSTQSACRTAIKKTRKAVESGNKKEAQSLLVSAQKMIMTAASKGMYHKNNARRKISRLAKAVNSANA